ncbi:MAG: S8 family serine peptidase [Saprospiraceae bacterium]
MKHFFPLIALIALVSWQLPINKDWSKKVDSQLLTKLEEGKKLEFLILINEQADVSGAKALTTKEAKGALVYHTLKATAENTQKTVRRVLDDAQATYRSFYVVNAIYAKGDLALVKRLGQLAAVAQIQPNPWVKLDEPEYRGNFQENARSLTWGLSKTGADQVWNLGYTGQGVVVAGQDTGTEWAHPAIRNQYRGWNGTAGKHDYNWHDGIREINPLHQDDTLLASNNPCGLNIMTPCDDHSHGTHTIGTMVGDDGQGNQIGMAPDAKWIACRNMERGWGSPASYIECFEFFLAPTDLQGNNPNPGMAPHVINNSWACPPVEGCNTGNFATMEAVVNNLKAAGIVVVVSAGNDGGSGCGSINSPAAIFENAFGVGAVQSNDTMANFSSRGLVMVDGSLRLKPNISAPGVGVKSAIRGGGYATWNGTSMAGPHVVGLVALLISANPSLAGQVELIEQIIEETALPAYSKYTCGGISPDQFPNPITGYGQINALAAVQKALTLSNNNEAPLTNSLKIFPNPTKGILNLNIEPWEGSVLMEWFNSTGQAVGTENWEAGPGVHQSFKLSNFAAGVYWYRLSIAGEVFSGKVIKE